MVRLRTPVGCNRREGSNPSFSVPWGRVRFMNPALFAPLPPGKHGKAEDARADQADSDSADQRKTDFAASVGKPGDKCIQGKGEGEKRGLGDYP